MSVNIIQTFDSYTQALTLKVVTIIMSLLNSTPEHNSCMSQRPIHQKKLQIHFFSLHVNNVITLVNLRHTLMN